MKIDGEELVPGDRLHWDMGHNPDIQHGIYEHERLSKLIGELGANASREVQAHEQTKAEIERLRAAANAVVDGWSAELNEGEMDPLIGKLRDALDRRALRDER